MNFLKGIIKYVLNYKTCNRDDILKIFGKPKDFEIYSEKPKDFEIYSDKSNNIFGCIFGELCRCGCNDFLYINFIGPNILRICCYKKINYTYYGHNIDGPTYIDFYTCDGNIYGIYYYYKNSLHRPFAPAIIEYNRKGFIIGEKYMLKNKPHNSIGPALRSFVRGVWVNEFYLNGYYISKENFYKLQKNMGKI